MLFAAICLNVLLPFTALAAEVVQSELKPIVARIETYGVRSVSREDVIAASGLKVGDNLENVVRSDADKDEMTKRIEALSGVHKASFAAIYGRLLEKDTLGLVVYLGIEEPGSMQLEFRQPPTGEFVLPLAITEASERTEQAFKNAMAQGVFEEDSSMGYSLSKDPELQEAQQEYVALAEEHWEQLVVVLHHSRDSKQRAIAAQVIAYAQDKRQIVQELMPAVRDPDPGVRNNSTRALSLIFRYAKVHPELEITAPPGLVQTLAKMLNSPEWLDRNKATGLLLSLDEDPAVLELLKEQSMPTLIEMSNWQTGHGTMAFMLLGRLVGMNHEELQETWNQGKQSRVIAHARELSKRR